MSKWVFPVYDHDFKSGIKSLTINGGTAPQYHLAHTLQWKGHQAQLIQLQGQTQYDADVVFIQSEWYEQELPYIEEARQKGAKIIVWVGHFIGGVYFDPRRIKADLYVTTWKGPVLDTLPYKTLYFPHAYCSACDKDQNVKSHNLLWFGNKYPLRDESWFDGLAIDRLNGIMPDMLGSYYRRAKISLNLHGEFQKGIVSDHPSTLAHVPGHALNERLFAIPGSGGFEISDWSPLIDECYTDDELVKCRSKEEYQGAVKYFLEHPLERERFIFNGHQRTLRDHTYAHRVEDLLKHL